MFRTVSTVPAFVIRGLMSAVERGANALTERKRRIAGRIYDLVHDGAFLDRRRANTDVRLRYRFVSLPPSLVAAAAGRNSIGHPLSPLPLASNIARAARSRSYQEMVLNWTINRMLDMPAFRAAIQENRTRSEHRSLTLDSYPTNDGWPDPLHRPAASYQRRGQARGD